MGARTASRAPARLREALVVVGVVVGAGLALWASQRLHWSADWTVAGRNSLSAPSRALLERLDGPLRISVFARHGGLAARAAAELLERYRRQRPDLVLEWIDPDRAPERARQAGVGGDGELVVHYQGRSARARGLGEAELSGALQRVARGSDRWIAYLVGHGERDLRGAANHDLGRFGGRLEARGFRLQPLDLAALGAVPDNTRVLVVSTPAADLLASEGPALAGYLRAGGNLLWLADPHGQGRLATLARELGLQLVPGTVIDPRARAAGIADPAFVPAAAYGHHRLLEGFRLVTVFPLAAAIRATAAQGWEVTWLVRSGLRSWAGSEPRGGQPRFREGRDSAGPLNLAVALSRPLGPAGRRIHPGRDEQRVVVFGDGDFLSNTYLGNGGNLDLGLRAIEWLAGDDRLIAIPARRAPDLDLRLGRALTLAIGFTALLGLPGGLLAIGWTVARVRRAR